MKNKNIKRCMLCILFIIVIFVNTSVFAITTGIFKDANNALSGDNIISNIGGTVFFLVRVVGTIIAVAYVIVLGIKYMLSSANDRADIKSKLIPFVIGAVIFFGTTTLIDWVIVFVVGRG
jgi:type IV secretory pathway VirB2 component (pilin)